MDEWQALPWWQQKLYADELAMDLAAERGEDPEEPASFEQRAAEAAQPTPPADQDAYLRSLGFNV